MEDDDTFSRPRDQPVEKRVHGYRNWGGGGFGVGKKKKRKEKKLTEMRDEWQKNGFRSSPEKKIASVTFGSTVVN